MPRSRYRRPRLLSRGFLRVDATSGYPPKLTLENGRSGLAARLELCPSGSSILRWRKRDLRRGRLLFAEAIGKETVQRYPRDLRRGIPERHIERPHRTATLAVTARFLAGHHQTPCAKRVEVGPCVVDEVSLAGGEQTSGETLANEPSLRETADRSEAIADDRTSSANDISNYCNGACGQTTGRNRWVSVAGDWKSAFPNLDDTHDHPLSPLPADNNPLMSASIVFRAAVPKSGEMAAKVPSAGSEWPTIPACTWYPHSASGLATICDAYPLSERAPDGQGNRGVADRSHECGSSRFSRPGQTRSIWQSMQPARAVWALM